MNKKQFAPGSKEAVSAGCICPVVDNGRGSGAYIDKNGVAVFWYNKKCPLHGKSEDVKPETVLYEINE